MDLSIGTFNLNNLFSRFNFRADIDTASRSTQGQDDIAGTYRFDASAAFALRTFEGRLVRGKDPIDTARIAARIRDMDVDVLAVQEVEDIDVLKRFNAVDLGGMYQEVVLIEGNDRRLIDVGVLSRLPLGAVTSFQTAVHPESPDERVFGRDLLAVEVLDRRRRRKLLTLYNTHLKSHFVHHSADQTSGRIRNNERRRRQAETVARLIGAQQRRGARYVLAGDMNDPVDSDHLAAMRTIDGDPLVDALRTPLESRPAKAETQGDGPRTPAWTYRRNPPGRDTPPEYWLYDQIWLSRGLADRLRSAHIGRRTRHGGDGSDHDPAWIHLAL